MTRAAVKSDRRSTTASSSHSIENAEVARIFRQMADVLEVEGENPFRIRAYRNAAKVVEELPKPIATLAKEHPEDLSELPGIGKDLAGKICEICQSGKLGALRTVERAAPKGAVELMQVPGLGPKKAKALCDALRVHCIEDLAKAAQRGRIHDLKGFGEKTEQKILHELAARGPEEHRMLRSTAAQYGEAIVKHLQAVPHVEHVEITGSYRRCKETVADLDILVSCQRSDEVIESFVTYHEVKEVLAKGSTKASIRLRCGLQVDLRALPRESYGAALHYFTGSKPHNIAIRRLGQQRGLKISEYGIFRGKRRVGGARENDVFDAVGLPWIAPELREQRGEIEAAREHRLPHLVELSDIRGDLHAHTTDSDGRDRLETMAEAAELLGHEYLAITDHSPALRMVRGLDAAGFRRQMARIDRVNKRLKKLTILKGAEVDIHPDGSLDLKDELLEALDLVIVSIHSKFDLPLKEQTARVLSAFKHPAVDILAHPTGRLIGKRRPMTLDMEQIYNAAADQGVMIEINAQPERLDIDDVSIRAAVAHDLRVVVNTDAHSTHELQFMRWGVDQARRGWAERINVANTRTLPNLLKLFHASRKR